MHAQRIRHDVAAVILAAGASRRLGEPKQLVRVHGETLLERTVRVAAEAGCSPILVVLGASSEAILAHTSLTPAEVLLNPEWDEGMASSIRAGIRALPPKTQAALLLTCDQPTVTAVHLQRLASSAATEPVASRYAGRHGVPAYFPANTFAELLRLSGDAGARLLLSTARAIDLPGGEIDVDTPESLRSARAIIEERTEQAE